MIRKLLYWAVNVIVTLLVVGVIVLLFWLDKVRFIY